MQTVPHAPELGALIHGDPYYGQLAGTQGGEELLITVGSASYDELAELSMALPHCPEVTWLGPLDEGSQERMALAERRPRGRPSSELPADGRACSVALALGATVLRVFRELEQRQLTSWGLPPSLVFHDPDARPGERAQVAIRYPLALPRLRRPCYGVMPMGDESYLPPELTAGGEWSTAASAWGLGALVAHWLLGRHPFAAPMPMEHLQAIHLGRPELGGIAPRLQAVVRSALDPRPEQRVAAHLLLEALREEAGDEPLAGI